jgi:hypothetical protein
VIEIELRGVIGIRIQPLGVVNWTRAPTHPQRLEQRNIVLSSRSPRWNRRPSLL